MNLESLKLIYGGNSWNVNLVKLLIVICIVLFSTQAFSANEDDFTHPKHVIFGGIGSADNENVNKSDDTPWSFGYLYRGDEYSKFFLGLDIAGEGTSLDNTSGNVNEINQGFSFNLLVGRPLNFSKNWQAGVGVLLGARETGESCPDSYLGYRCYADEDPETDYDFNYGAVFHLIYKHALIGLRASGESTQLLFGVVF